MVIQTASFCIKQKKISNEINWKEKKISNETLEESKKRSQTDGPKKRRASWCKTRKCPISWTIGSVEVLKVQKLFNYTITRFSEFRILPDGQNQPYGFSIRFRDVIPDPGQRGVWRNRRRKLLGGAWTEVSTCQIFYLTKLSSPTLRTHPSEKLKEVEQILFFFLHTIYINGN